VITKTADTPKNVCCGKDLKPDPQAVGDYSHSFSGFSYLLFMVAYILKTGHFPYIFLCVLYSIQARVAKSVAITRKEWFHLVLLLPNQAFSAAVAIQ